MCVFVQPSPACTHHEASTVLRPRPKAPCPSHIENHGNSYRGVASRIRGALLRASVVLSRSAHQKLVSALEWNALCHASFLLLRYSSGYFLGFNKPPAGMVWEPRLGA
eukprot:1161666-Pelagomonas_calceolata.AAC.5